MIKIYTDGGCRPTNPGPGAFSVVAVLGDGSVTSYAEAYTKTTNNRMELMAVIRAIQMYAPQHPVVIYTDSTYVSIPVSSGRLLRRTRLELEQKPNCDLWLELQSLLFLYTNVKVLWVRGHNGNEYNEFADDMVYIANTGGCDRKKDHGYQQV